MEHLIVTNIPSVFPVPFPDGAPLRKVAILPAKASVFTRVLTMHSIRSRVYVPIRDERISGNGCRHAHSFDVLSVLPVTRFRFEPDDLTLLLIRTVPVELATMLVGASCKISCGAC